MLVALENADEILQILDRFTKQKSKDIPAELEEYINYVAKTGDTVYRWPTVQYLFREKLRNVIKEFHDTTASIEDLPQCPNVDQFNYESMKTLLFERFDNFQAAPFTIQRLCELLTDPKKHYSRLDKFMRALEKNILVVSTVPPGRKMANGTDGNESTMSDETEINIDMEVIKSEEKRQNGNKEDHNEVNSTEKTPEGGESTSAQALSEDVKKEEIKKVESEVSEKSTDAEKPAVSVEPKTEIKTETEDVAAAKTETVTTTEKDETKPVETVEQAATVKEEKVIPKVEEEVAKIEDKDEKMNETSESVKIEAEVKKEDSIIEKITPLEEEMKPEAESNGTKPVEIEKPPTPKRRSDDEDDENVVSNGSCAKKIRLDLDEAEEEEEKVTEVATETKEAATTEPEAAKEPVASSEVDLPKESDILESISTEIDAQTENELLEDVVDSTLAAEKDSINIDVKPIEENIVLDSEVPKPAEELPATEDLLKTDAPVAIPSDLDFTPDEALNELVSSDILAAIPEQPVIDEVKMSDESATVEPVASTDDMAVENTETNTADADNAMEAAPIKADEEQMDVDESNSVDAMDL